MNTTTQTTNSNINPYGSMNVNLDEIEVSESIYNYVLKHYAGLYFHKKRDGKFLLKPVNKHFQEILTDILIVEKGN